MRETRRYTGSMGPVQQIREGRRRAGLTQAELARRVGTSQPAINRYERGVASPSDATLRRILQACDTDRRPSDALRDHRDEVLELLRRNGARRVYVFGSVARGEDDSRSDIDLLVDHLDRDAYAWGVPKVEREIEELLGVAVDLGEIDAMRPSVAAHALEDARPL